MTSEQWQDLRAHVVATGRSQQLPLADLKIVLQLVDEAMETGWSPPAEWELRAEEFKLP
jgi:hypothetical protein